MKRHQERHQKPYNVEFGMEFGDINAAKLYELPIADKNDKTEARKDK
jgi:hypothetical protein